VYTNQDTHRLVRENLARSPIATGFIGVRPRYCPPLRKRSRASRTSRAPALPRARGLATTEVYVQGCFTSMPEDVQLAMLRTIPALAKARIMRAGYAIEYDFCPPTQISASLETRRVEGCSTPGRSTALQVMRRRQLRGCSLASMPCASCREGRLSCCDATQAYIGVLIDDIVTKRSPSPIAS